jgi:Ca2+-binding EF-hand superfamily protein
VAYHEFRQLLKSLFGNYVRAWRVIDADGSWSLSMSEVFTTCKRLGYKGKVRPLWKALDVYNEGTAKIENIDRESAEVLAQFRRWCISKGGLDKVYEQMDKDNLKKIKIDIFLKRCKKMGYKRPKETLEFLFKCLDLDGFGHLSPSNFAFLEDWRPPDWITAQADPKAVEVLKQKLKAGYGNFIKAWRQCLDTDSSNKVTWAEFNRACEKLKFSPKPRRAAAWRGLDDDNSGYITLAELDPESNEQLINFRSWADENFGSIRLAFKQLDRDKSGHLSYAEFRSAVAKYGLIGDTRMLFDAFDTNMIGAITLDNMTFLESWEIDDADKVVLPKKKKKKQKLTAHIAPRLALYRSQYEKDVAEKLTEEMAGTGKISRKSTSFGFTRELEELRRQEEIESYTRMRKKQLFLESMTKAKPLEENEFGYKPLAEDFHLAEKEPPPEFVTSCSSWILGTTLRDGEALPHGYSAPLLMPAGLFDEFFSTGESTKPSSVLDLPQIPTSSSTPQLVGEVTAADLPDLSEMFAARDQRKQQALGKQQKAVGVDAPKALA